MKDRLMIIRARLHHVLLPSVVFACFGCPPLRALENDEPVQHSQVASLPAEMQSQLERISEALGRGHFDWSQTEAGEDRARNLASPVTFSVRFERERFRSRVEWIEPKGFGYELRGGPKTSEFAFDGKFCYTGEPDFGSPTVPAILCKHDPLDDSDPERLLRMVNLDYLELAGFSAPECPTDCAKSPLVSSVLLHYAKESDLTKVQADGDVLRISFRVPDPVLARARALNLERERERLSKLKNGPEYVSKQIKELEDMRSQPPRRFVNVVVDPKRGYAILEREDTTLAGQTILRAWSDHWAHYTPPDLWMPRRIIEDFYTDRWKIIGFSDQPRVTLTYELEHAKFGGNEMTEFNLPLEYKKAATLVSDYSVPEAKAVSDHHIDYVVAADGKLMRGSALDVLAQIHDWRALAKTACLLVLILGLPPLLYAIIHFRASRRA